jgi:hypothetical protein
MPTLAHYFVSPHDHDQYSGCHELAHDVGIPPVCRGMSIVPVRANQHGIGTRRFQNGIR